MRTVEERNPCGTKMTMKNGSCACKSGYGARESSFTGGSVCQVDNRLLDQPPKQEPSEFDALFFGRAAASRMLEHTEPFGGNGRIIGGAKVDDTSKWPFFVLIDGQQCAGAIIGQHFVLTSAQCCTKQRKFIHFGKHSGMTNTALSGVWKQISHPNYNPKTMNENLCIIHFSAIIEYGPLIQPINIASGLEEPGHNLWTAGFGTDRIVSNTPMKYMKEAKMPMRDQSACKKQYRDSGGYFNKTTMVCTGSTTAQVGPCKGDSGGPLVDIIANDDGSISKRLVGVTSFGRGCGSPEFGSVFSRIDTRVDWIKETVIELHCSRFPRDFVCLERTLNSNGCPKGYARPKNNPSGSCEDIDECALGGDACGDGGICENVDGQFNCICKPGFRNNEMNFCVDIDECSSSEANECGLNTDCVNHYGGFTCYCKNGFKARNKYLFTSSITID